MCEHHLLAVRAIATDDPGVRVDVRIGELVPPVRPVVRDPGIAIRVVLRGEGERLRGARNEDDVRVPVPVGQRGDRGSGVGR